MKNVLKWIASCRLNKRFASTLLFVGFSVALYAQTQIMHTPPATLEKNAIATLSFRVPGLQADAVSEAYLQYSFDTDPTVQRKSATLSDDIYSINIDLTGSNAGTLQYAFYLEMVGGTIISFPENDPEKNRPSVALIEPQVSAKSREGRVGKIDFTVLSPEPGATVNPLDVVVAITLFYKEGDASPEQFQLKVNGKDVTGEADVTPYLISWVPKEPPADGNLNVELLMKNDKGRMVSLVGFKSKVSKKAKSEERKESGVTAVGNGELSARNQMIAGQSQDVYRGNFNLNARYKNVRFSANGLATSLENARLQPQNRLAAELYLGKWFEIQAGHIYPVMNNLAMNGRRIYGVNSGLYLFNRNLGFQVMYGEMNRRVESLYSNVVFNPQYTLLSNGDTLRDGSTGQPVVTPQYVLNNQPNGFGTYTRKVMGGRFNLGNGRIFGLGISALKVEDDTTSITNIRNLNATPASLLSGLTPAQRAELTANPNLLKVNATNPQAKGNFIVASDFVLNLHKGKFRIAADGAVNLLNEDIGPGVLNKDRAKDLGFEIDDNISDMLDRLSAIIIINENMRALPIRFEQNANGDWETKPFVPTSIFAGQASLNMNYFNNNISAQYMWMGPDFTPLSNTAVRRDIAGFSVNDRIRMFRNRVFITGGFDQFHDNVLGNLEATTTTTSYRGGIGWYPFKTVLPRINLNYRYQNRDNGFRSENTLAGNGFENRAVRNLRSITSDSLRLLPNARFNDTYQYSGTISQQINVLGSIHDLMVGYTQVDTRDREFFYGDYSSAIYTGGLTSRWGNLPLKTMLNYTLNNTKALSGLNSIDIAGYSAGFEMLLFQSKLQINADLAVAYNTLSNRDLMVMDNGTPDNVFDDFFAPDDNSFTKTRSINYIANASARYNLSKNHAFAVLFNYVSVNNRQAAGPVLPNDQIIQARYIVTF